MNKTCNFLCNIYNRVFYRFFPKLKEDLHGSISMEDLILHNNLKKLKGETEINEALLQAIKAKDVKYVEALIKKGATNLKQGLLLACKENSYVIAEVFAKTGIDVMPGIIVTKSLNISNMLYRYKQKSELIK